MQEINDNTFLEKQQEDIIREQEEDQVEERSIEDIQVIKDVKETRKTEETNEKVATFLHEKGLSDNLVKTLINSDLTDEHVRLAELINFRYFCINQNLLPKRCEINFMIVCYIKKILKKINKM